MLIYTLWAERTALKVNGFGRNVEKCKPWQILGVIRAVETV